MAPAIAACALRLSYPLYALDFDPEDADCLVVGGGGGAARSGVGNKVSVLDTSREDSLQVVSELELSRDEDSVNTLAVGPRTKNSVLFYAGINSAEEDLKRGKNEHFRVFAADLPSTATAEPKIAELSRSALFSTTDADTYQRLLSISSQVGAAATGTTGRAKNAQIAVFDLPSAGSNSRAPKLRGTLELTKEAMDMDMTQFSVDEHQLVYCDDYNIYTVIVGKTDTNGPHCVFNIPNDDSSGAARPTFRCMRFLTPTFVLAVANKPKAGGVVLQGFRLPKPSDLGNEEEGSARLAISVHLPKTVARATGMAVRNLSPPAITSAKQSDAQFVIAVTGQDGSILIYTLEHQTVGDVNLITNLHPVTTLKDVHLGPISGLAFSHFNPSSKASASAASSPKSLQRPPHLKLASIGSMGNTCAVHSLPLKRLTTTNTATKQTTTRYVLGLKSRPPSPTALFLGFATFFAFLALLLQAVLEVKGLSQPVIGARSLTPVSWHAPGRYYGIAESKPPITPLPDSILEQYRALAAAAEEERELRESKRVILHHGGEGEGEVRVEELDAERHGEAREWEDLQPSQREAWKERLKEAGHWGEEMGEAVFKGVLFGQIAGAVGAMI